MTRTLAAIGLAVGMLTGACGFDADYDGGTYRCGDGACPTGLACVAGVCVDPAAPDAPPPDTDPDVDAPPPDAAAALSCGDPGDLARGADEVRAGTTAGAPSHVAAMCAGGVYNGPDHVYRATAEAGDGVTVTLDAVTGVRAYVLAATCPPSPATPTCVGGDPAAPGVPLAVADLPAGDVYVVVDDVNPAGGGSYQLTVRVGP